MCHNLLMQLRVNNLNYNLENLARRIGYVPDHLTPAGELSAVRRFGGDYPRFHLYMAPAAEVLTLNLHLDQKRSSYEGTAAHGGEYEGETVAQEMERIREIIFNS